MRSLEKFALLLFVLASLQQRVQAGTILYDDSRGLSSNHINRVVKDRSGLLWIATNNGLNTFDGYNFKEIAFFKKKTINTLSYDSMANRMWVGASEGLFMFDLTASLVSDYSSKMPQKTVYEILEHRSNRYVIFQHGTIIRIGVKGEIEPVFRLPGGKPGELRKFCGLDDSGHLFISTTDQPNLLMMDLRTRAIRVLRNIAAKEVWGIVKVKGSCVVIYQNKGMEYLGTKPRSPLLDPVMQSNYRLGNLHESHGELYGALRGFYGLYRFGRETGRWELMASNDNVSFRSKVITTIWRDAHDVLWIGTNKGLIKMTPERPKRFKVLFEGYSPSVSTRQIVGKKPGEIFVASYNGIYRCQLHPARAVLIDSTEYDSVFPLYTRALYYQPGGYLYAGTETHENFIYRVDLARNKCEGSFFTKTPDSVRVNSVYSIYKGKRDMLWLATDKGLASIDRKGEQVEVYTSGRFDAGENRLFYLSPSVSPGKFWAAGRSCLFLVDEVAGIENRYTSASAEFTLPDDDYIFAEEVNPGKVWITTKKSGIVIIDFTNRSVRHITRADGLPANEVYGILWQDERIAWISTVNGLCRYDTRAGTFYNYFFEDGLSDNEFNQNSFFKGPDGTFYFGGINGVNYFNPAELVPESEKLTIFSASAVKWNQARQSFAELNPNELIRMQPKDHLLSFTFGLSDYSNVDACSYFYRIRGLYNDWVSLGSQNILRLEGLPAGNYHVEVIGYNKRGIKAANMLVYDIEILQVFYKTWWFYVLLALLLVLLVFAYFKWRLQNIKQKLRLRTQIASNLHDEVGSLLTSIIISTDSARYSADTMEEKDRKLEKISALSREATSTMSDVLWSIDARNDYAGNLTDRMREQAEAMLMPLGVEVEFDLSMSQQNRNIGPDTRQQLYLIFKEAVNNIAKHSQATLVKVTYMQQGQRFCMRVENNHAPAAEQVAHSGQGLKNIRMRAARIGAGCYVSRKEDWFVVEVSNQRVT